MEYSSGCTCLCFRGIMSLPKLPKLVALLASFGICSLLFTWALHDSTVDHMETLQRAKCDIISTIYSISSGDEAAGITRSETSSNVRGRRNSAEMFSSRLTNICSTECTNMYPDNVLVPPLESSGIESRLQQAQISLSNALESVHRLEPSIAYLSEERSTRCHLSSDSRSCKAVTEALSNQLERRAEHYQYVEMARMDIAQSEKRMDQLHFGRECRMKSCFDHDRCSGGMSFYVYPDVVHHRSISNETVRSSALWASILRILRQHPQCTADPLNACLLIPSVDLLDRDSLSSDRMANVEAVLHGLPYWNNGTNHLLFNLFTGSYPHYDNILDVNIGNAMLASSTFTREIFRDGFDISIPHIKDGHWIWEANLQNETSQPRTILASFKGKRYLDGKGVEPRTSLRSLDDGSSFVIVLTCRHEDQESQTEQDCVRDQKRYDEIDYNELLDRSVFSLCPRGRRISTYRFMESIRRGAIPVVLADGFIPPFTETIDWSDLAVFVPERSVAAIPEVLRSITRQSIASMQDHLRTTYSSHLSSLSSILHEVLVTVERRLSPVSDLISHPEALNGLSTIQYIRSRTTQQNIQDAVSPLYRTSAPGPWIGSSYTVAILVHDRFNILFENLNDYVRHFRRVDRVVIVANSPPAMPSKSEWPSLNVPVDVYVMDRNSLNNRFIPLPSIYTDAVLIIDDDVMLNADEVELGFDTWRQRKQSIVGWPARRHVWDVTNSQWVYSSEYTDMYSMVLTGGAFIHKSLMRHYTYGFDRKIYATVEKYMNCEDIAINMMVANLTREPPLKVTGRWTFGCKQCKSTISSKSSMPGDPKGLHAHFEKRSTCINDFTALFQYQPLILTQGRVDPIVYDGATALSLKKSGSAHYPSIRVPL